MAIPRTSPCPHCGRPVAEGRRCVYCASLPTSQAAAPASPESGAPPPLTPRHTPVPSQAPGARHPVHPGVLPPAAQRPAARPNPIRIPIWAALLALVALGAGVVALFNWATYDGESLCIVNTTDRADLDVFVDGKLRARQVPSMKVEAKENARVLQLSPGSYHLETRDAGGAVLDQADLEVVRHSHGYLYLPLRSEAACFALDTATYGVPGSTGGPEGYLQRLDGQGNLVQLPMFVTRWFVENPSSVLVQKGTKSDFERALRLVPCPRPG